MTLACRLTEKALQSGQTVYLHAQHEQQAHHLDKLLWTFSQGGFVPHELWQAQTETADCPVLIGHSAPPDEHHSILINLAAEVPTFFSRFERLLEIVDPGDPAPGRQRYQYYKDRGYPLETHKI